MMNKEKFCLHWIHHMFYKINFVEKYNLRCFFHSDNESDENEED